MGYDGCNASFVINMPSSFDASLVNFTDRSYSSMDETESILPWTAKDINATLWGGLSNYEGVTLKNTAGLRVILRMQKRRGFPIGFWASSYRARCF
jgi:hypothetical protein